VESIAINPPSRAPVLPKAVALALTKFSQSLWWPTLCPDEVERRYIDDVDVPGDWEAVGVTPSEIESHALTYLRRYRSAFVFCSISLTASSLLTSTEKTLFGLLFFLLELYVMPSPILLDLEFTP
jgi:hypothetical protein